tara:strand:+ start:6858 stop:7313 length:456 start_codon:yes stop_codon:yes gene_type:complete
VKPTTIVWEELFVEFFVAALGVAGLKVVANRQSKIGSGTCFKEYVCMTGKMLSSADLAKKAEGFFFRNLANLTSFMPMYFDETHDELWGAGVNHLPVVYVEIKMESNDETKSLIFITVAVQYHCIVQDAGLRWHYVNSWLLSSKSTKTTSE